MKYTGRIISATISLMVGIPYVIYNFKTLQSPFRTMIDTSVLIVTTLTLYMLGKQYDKAKFFSEKDYLTGLYNRRFIDEIFPKLKSSVDRKNQQLSLLILDCNNFKQINDTYGHKAGDLVLKDVSSMLLTCVRDCDIIARWGGDEFLIVAPNSDQEGIKTMIKCIEKELNELSKRSGNHISVSAGMAIYPNDSNNLDNLIKIADKNMYKLKSLNRKTYLKR
ncbi:GGDEF domain-containing protein [Bacillus sp. ISL-18]|uniref:GGDEF domain-containing protein n=1 Tax=Bacillus sp. ISL-18 TaxID=2819118 RepID=UPI001BE6A277|nr:GGDEF domain-containing protein [Bacillus sp. ISL-18]MBT2658645.1 GGDEF domain-containing protein [Bacillus sp. ISL-18]